MMRLIYIVYNARSHEIKFLRRFGTLYGLLKSLVTSKINITNANIDHVAFIAYLLMGYYDKNFFTKRAELSKKESDSCQTKASSMAKIIYNKSKKNDQKA